MTVLLLGGTSDARRMAAYLHENGVKLIYSVAGLVRLPILPCQIISGGFSQFGGLKNYIEQHDITAILDITHPYAEKMSNSARQMAIACGIPCWRFSRLPWVEMDGDDWHEVDNWQQILPELEDKKVVFLTAGQVELQVLHDLLELSADKRIILRTAVKPHYILPERVEWIKAIGPFEMELELNLFKQYGVDVVVSKNSGGDAVVAKIYAARQLKIPVFMFSRPIKQPVEINFTDHSICAEFVTAQCAESFEAK